MGGLKKIGTEVVRRLYIISFGPLIQGWAGSFDTGVGVQDLDSTSGRLRGD